MTRIRFIADHPKGGSPSESRHTHPFLLPKNRVESCISRRLKEFILDARSKVRSDRRAHSGPDSWGRANVDHPIRRFLLVELREGAGGRQYGRPRNWKRRFAQSGSVHHRAIEEVRPRACRRERLLSDREIRSAPGG